MSRSRSSSSSNERRWGEAVAVDADSGTSKSLTSKGVSRALPFATAALALALASCDSGSSRPQPAPTETATATTSSGTSESATTSMPAPVDAGSDADASAERAIDKLTDVTTPKELSSFLNMIPDIDEAALLGPQNANEQGLHNVRSKRALKPADARDYKFVDLHGKIRPQGFNYLLLLRDVPIKELRENYSYQPVEIKFILLGSPEVLKVQNEKGAITFDELKDALKKRGLNVSLVKTPHPKHSNVYCFYLHFEGNDNVEPKLNPDGVSAHVLTVVPQVGKDLMIGASAFDIEMPK